MIGVVTRAEERDIAREFFELFKTPWEFSRANGRYEVVVDDGSDITPHPAKLVLIYGGQPTAFDHRRKSIVGPQRRNTTLSYNGDRIPVYGSCVTFPSDGATPRLALEDSGESVISVTRAD